VIIGPSEVATCESAGEVRTTAWPLVITPAVPVTITPPSRDAWDEHGWRSLRRGKDTLYEGDYRAQRGSGHRATFPGRVLVRDGAISAYVADPPVQIRRHPKGPCFQLANPPWFRVHWHRPPTSVDDAILYVERILNEVLT